MNGGNQFNPAIIAQQAQDPAHPANPNHPKVCCVLVCATPLLLGVENEKNTKRKEANVVFSTTNGLPNWRINLVMRQSTVLERRSARIWLMML